MSAPYIIYNGVSSADLGLIVERLPDFHRAPRRYKEQTIPGRSGALVVDEGGYDLSTAVLELNTAGRDLRDVYAWLRGEGWMISSDEPEYMAYAYLYNGVEDRRFRLSPGAGGAWDTLSIDLRLEPYLRLVDEPAVTLTQAGLFDGQGHDESAPAITVTGSGNITLMVNDASVLIDGLDGSITIDSDTGLAYTLGAGGAMAFAGGMVTLDGGDWPALLPAGHSNRISWSGSVTQVAVQPNWRFL